MHSNGLFCKYDNDNSNKLKIANDIKESKLYDEKRSVFTKKFDKKNLFIIICKKFPSLKKKLSVNKGMILMVLVIITQKNYLDKVRSKNIPVYIANRKQYYQSRVSKCTSG